MSINPNSTFEIWAIDFARPFPKPSHRIGARYIIIAIEYVTKWENEKPIESCTKDVATKFIYENIISRFVFPITLISGRGNHFINYTIDILLKEFIVDHHKISTYHPHSNGTIQSFNKTLNKGLTKVYSIDKSDWDDKILAILWAYIKTYKISSSQKKFKMLYSQDAVVPFHFKQHAQ